ncbi:hypothetical protein PSTT_01209 [Puccinia striiformis]|uniref:DDE Tnp4 domain-containing protein n=1 Tax=Puccinia striiformis TaxID=27350 RepID=A0A2S4W4T0_9BASI|nr:hypothetical protein PSTT_01209 [Puccinia striiformis]
MANLSIAQRALLAMFTILLLIEISEEDLLAYYSDGGQAKFVRFLLHKARPELFREATSRTILSQSSGCTRWVIPKVCQSDTKGRTARTTTRSKVQCIQKVHRGSGRCFHSNDITNREQPSYRNRKGVIAQNVLAVVNFDMEFLYVLAGWEGSAHDSRVIADAFTKHLSIPDGRYYLADAGYALQQGLITPFQGVRYHLKEQATCSLKPGNPKELFNLRHASLRNVVERIFGCLKSKFKILTSPTEHNMDSQVQLVYALVVLWNFLRHHNQYEDVPEFDETTRGHDTSGDIDPDAPGAKYRCTRAEDTRMVVKRNLLAERMWQQYCEYLSRR